MRNDRKMKRTKRIEGVFPFSIWMSIERWEMNKSIRHTFLVEKKRVHSIREGFWKCRLVLYFSLLLLLLVTQIWAVLATISVTSHIFASAADVSDWRSRLDPNEIDQIHIPIEAANEMRYCLYCDRRVFVISWLLQFYFVDALHISTSLSSSSLRFFFLLYTT